MKNLKMSSLVYMSLLMCISQSARAFNPYFMYSYHKDSSADASDSSASSAAEASVAVANVSPAQVEVVAEPQSETAEVDPLASFPQYVFKDMAEIRGHNIDLKFDAEKGILSVKGLLPRGCIGNFGFYIDDLNAQNQYVVSAEFAKSGKNECNEALIDSCNRYTCIDASVASEFLFGISSDARNLEMTKDGVKLKKTGDIVFAYDDVTKPMGEEAIQIDPSFKLSFVDAETKAKLAEEQAREEFNLHMGEMCEAAMGGDAAAIAELESMGASREFVTELNSNLAGAELEKLESKITSISTLKDVESMIKELKKYGKDKDISAELKSKAAEDLASLVTVLSTLEDESIENTYLLEDKKLALAKDALKAAISVNSKEPSYRLGLNKIRLDRAMNGAKSGDSFFYNTAMRDARAGAADVNSMYNRAAMKGAVSPELNALVGQYKQQFSPAMMPQVPTLNQQGIFPNPIGTALDSTFLSAMEANAKATATTQPTMTIAQQYSSMANPSLNPITGF